MTTSNAPAICSTSSGSRLARSAARLLDLVGQQIQQAVRSLPHVADSLTQLGQQRLAPQLLHLLVEEDALEMARARDLAGAQRADEDIALPLRESVAGVERHAGDRDRRHPVDERRLEARVSRALDLPRPRIGAAVAHERPSVVGAGLEDVDLVAAVRAVLVEPHLAGARMHRQPERAAVSERVDLRLCAGACPRTGCPAGCCRRRGAAAPCHPGRWDSAGSSDPSACRPVVVT